MKMNKLQKVEPMHQCPKGENHFFWDKKLECIPAEDDLYVGKGATYSIYSDFPYTIVEVSGELGNRIAKLRECDYIDGEYYDTEDPVVKEWSPREDGFLYIKEKDISFKRKSGISYKKVYLKDPQTNRLRACRSGYVWVGNRRRNIPREL